MKRFDYGFPFPRRMSERPDGEYVLFDEADAEISRLRAELETVTKQRDEARAAESALDAATTKIRNLLTAAGYFGTTSDRRVVLPASQSVALVITDLVAARAELAKERAACDSTIGVLRSYLSCESVARALTKAERDAIKRSLSDHDARRGAVAEEKDGS